RQRGAPRSTRGSHGSSRRPTARPPGFCRSFVYPRPQTLTVHAAGEESAEAAQRVRRVSVGLGRAVLLATGLGVGGRLNCAPRGRLGRHGGGLVVVTDPGE